VDPWHVTHYIYYNELTLYLLVKIVVILLKLLILSALCECATLNTLSAHFTRFLVLLFCLGRLSLVIVAGAGFVGITVTVVQRQQFPLLETVLC
jgi:hypothetical protein